MQTRITSLCHASPFSQALLAFSFLRFMLRLNLDILCMSARNCFLNLRADRCVILPVIEHSNGPYPADHISLLYVHSPFVSWAVCMLANGTNAPSSVCMNNVPMIPSQSCGGIFMLPSPPSHDVKPDPFWKQRIIKINTILMRFRKADEHHRFKLCHSETPPF